MIVEYPSGARAIARPVHVRRELDRQRARRRSSATRASSSRCCPRACCARPARGLGQARGLGPALGHRPRRRGAPGAATPTSSTSASISAPATSSTSSSRWPCAKAGRPRSRSRKACAASRPGWPRTAASRRAAGRAARGAAGGLVKRRLESRDDGRAANLRPSSLTRRRAAPGAAARPRRRHRRACGTATRRCCARRAASGCTAPRQSALLSAGAVFEPARLPALPLAGPRAHDRSRTSTTTPHSLHGVGWHRAVAGGGAAPPTAPSCGYATRADGDWPFAVRRRRSASCCAPVAGRLHLRDHQHRHRRRSRSGSAGTRISRSARRSRLHVECADALGTDAGRSCRRASVAQPGIDGEVAAPDFDHCFEGWTRRGAACATRSCRCGSRRRCATWWSTRRRTQRLLLRRAGQPRQQRDHMADPPRTALVALAAGRQRSSAWMTLEVEPLLKEPTSLIERVCRWRPSVLGESPLWHPREQALYWCDIPGHTLNRYDPASGRHAQLGLRQRRRLLRAADRRRPAARAAQRPGALRPRQRHLTRCSPDAPYDAARRALQRRQGRCAGALLGRHDLRAARRAARASLYRCGAAGLERVAGDITSATGWPGAPTARTMYWADTKRTRSSRVGLRPAARPLSRRRVFARFARASREPAARPSTAAGPTAPRSTPKAATGSRCSKARACCASRPAASCCTSVPLPVRCPTMPCFGGSRPAHALHHHRAREPARGRARARCRSPAACCSCASTCRDCRPTS